MNYIVLTSLNARGDGAPPDRKKWHGSKNDSRWKIAMIPIYGKEKKWQKCPDGAWYRLGSFYKSSLALEILADESCVVLL